MATDVLAPIPLNAAPSLQIIDNFDDAEARRPEWHDLLERSVRNELTQAPDWLLPWWRVFGDLDGRRLRIGLFRDGDRLIGLAPLLWRRHWYRGFLPFRRLELLASGEVEGDAIVSNHIGIIAERGAEATVARRFVDALADGAFGSWDEIVLPMMSGDTAMPELLIAAFRAAGYSAESMEAAGAPFITLPATWDEYLAKLPGKERKNLKRQLRLFDEWSGGTTELESVSTVGDLERGKKILVDLHQARWASEAQSGVFRSPLFSAFHDATMYDLAERGVLEILILRARGEPVAALQTYVWADKVTAYQTGRHPDLPQNLSPGSVIFAWAIRRAIEQGRREFDMLADAVHYKLQLTQQIRPLVQVRVARSCVVEWLRRAGVGIARWMRRGEEPKEAQG